jgi:hypothetical protein
MNHHEGLPSYCYAVHPVDGEVIRLVAGEKGYYVSNYQAHGDQSAQNVADDLNAGLGVSKAQVEAMECGSLFGFHVPGANPAIYEGKV